MKTFLLLLGVVVLAFGLSTAAGATSINYSFGTSGNEFVSPYSGVTTETFNTTALGSLPPGWTTGSPPAQVVQGSVANSYAAPAGVGGVPDASHYLEVPASGFATESFTQSYNYFGIWWGSVDSYNTLTFYEGATEVASFTGSQVTSPTPANGNQTAPGTNLYVNFVGLPQFNSFTMTSTAPAFEADNIAVGNVPEPMSILLLGLGLLGISGLSWKLSR